MKTTRVVPCGEVSGFGLEPDHAGGAEVVQRGGEAGAFKPFGRELVESGESAGVNE